MIVDTGRPVHPAGHLDAGDRPPSAAARPLRRLPVPVCEPVLPRTVTGYCGEAGRPPMGQGVLSLSFSTHRDPFDQDPDFGPRPTASRDLPDPHAAVSALVQAVVEVLAGTRSPAQLSRHLSTDVHAAITRRAALAARLRRGEAPGGRRAVVRGVRVCEPADGVVEASAVVVDRDRVRAVALRLEGVDGRWRATAVEVG